MDTQCAKGKNRREPSNQQDLAMQGGKGQARPCSMGSKGARRLPRRGSGRDSPDGIQPAYGWSMGARGERSLPFGHGGVGGAGTLHLTGDATATRCTGFDDLRKRCRLHRRHLGKKWRFGEAGLPEGMQRGTRSGCPLPRLRWYYHRHLADHAIA